MKFINTNKLKIGLLGLLLVLPFAINNNFNKEAGVSAWSGTQTSQAATYYSSVASETGEALRSKLNTIISLLALSSIAGYMYYLRTKKTD